MPLFISIPTSAAPAANAAAVANFEDSANIFTPNASADGKAPATHCVCSVNATPEGEVLIKQLAATLGGVVTSFELPELAWVEHGLKPVFVEKFNAQP